MPRSRPAGDPVSFHGPSDQYYVTRGGRRLHLGSDRDIAMQKYHRLSAGLSEEEKLVCHLPISANEPANRFLAVQQANWRNRASTLRGYPD